MVKVNKDGFKIFFNSNWGEFLVIESHNISNSIEYIIKNNIKNVHVNSYHGYSLKHLEFLDEISTYIEGFTSPDNNLNFEKVNSLKNLKFLGLPKIQYGEIFLGNFPLLEKCAITYSKKVRGLELCLNLNELILSNFTSNDRNMESFPELPNLEYLELLNGNLQNFKGIGKLKKLSKLSVYKLQDLTLLSCLKELQNKLKYLQIENCRKIVDYPELGNLSNLEKLIIGNCGSIESLNFVPKLPNLHFISFVGTIINDGDISPCLGLEYVGFDDNRSYSHKQSEVKKMIEGRKT